MSALCRVLSFATEQRRIKFHPIPSFHRLYKSDRADKTWSQELQQQFMRTARPAMVTAMILVRSTAMRAADIRKFAWSHRVQIRSQKTVKLLWIPATRELKAYLDALTKEGRKGALVILTTTGKAYARRCFNDHWREDCDKVDAENAKLAEIGAEALKCADLNFHNNRGTAATLLAEAGATAPEIAEALTWTVDKAQRVIDAYLARRGVLAANAIKKLEDYRDKKAGKLGTAWATDACGQHATALAAALLKKICLLGVHDGGVVVMFLAYEHCSSDLPSVGVDLMNVCRLARDFLESFLPSFSFVIVGRKASAEAETKDGRSRRRTLPHRESPVDQVNLVESRSHGNVP